MLMTPDFLALLLVGVLCLTSALLFTLVLRAFWRVRPIYPWAAGVFLAALLAWPLHQIRFALFESVYLRAQGKGPGITRVVTEIHDILSLEAFPQSTLNHPENEDLRACLAGRFTPCPLVPASFAIASPRPPQLLRSSVLAGTRRRPQRYTLTGIPCWDPLRLKCSGKAFPIEISAAFSAGGDALFAGFCARFAKEAQMPTQMNATPSAGCTALHKGLDPTRQISIEGVPAIYGYSIRAGRILRVGAPK